MSKIYLFFGEEKYDLDLAVEKIKKEFDKLEVGLNLFYVTNDNLDELSTLCDEVTFFGSKKLIIIKDTKLKFNVDLISSADDDVTFVIIEDSVDKRLSEYKKLSKIAQITEFKHLDEKQIVTYIMTILKKYDIKISKEDAEYMQSICGEEKSNIVNELQKLVIYLGKSSIVTKDVIEKICSKTLNAKIFDLLDDIVNKNKQSAILKLDQILKQKESIVKIYIMLYKQIKQMYMIKYLKEKKVYNILQVIKMHPYTFKKLNLAVDKYTLNELKNIIYLFGEYDYKTKNGDMDFEIGLKEIICNM